MENIIKNKNMKKIVINKCFGGFGLTHEAIMRYAELSGFKLYPFVEERQVKGKEWSPRTSKHKDYINEESKDNPYDLIHYSTSPLKNGKYKENSYFSDRDIKRDDVNLIKVVEEMKEKANGHYAYLTVVEIPDDIEWEILEYDGMESVEEKHRSWN